MAPRLLRLKAMVKQDTASRIDAVLEGSGVSRQLIDRALTALRWAILATILFITWLWPFTGRIGYLLWGYVLVFVAYNALIELLRWRTRFFQSYARVALCDLPVAATLFFLDYSPGGPLFVLFYLGLISAALTMSALGTIAYTAAIIIVVTAIAPTLPGWNASVDDLRQLSARLLVFALVGIGSALLTQRLVNEMQTSRLMHDEALRMEALDRLRDEFVAAVSHDLRTPMTAVRAGLGLFEMRASARLTDDERQLLDTTRRNVERLGLLIDDLLAYNQIETDTLHLDLVPVELGAVIGDAAATVDSLLVEKDQLLEIAVCEPLRVTGDARRLEQVFVNLLANASQHTPRGTHIAVLASTESDGIVVTVRDDGPGIPVEHLPHIFERFHHRADIGGGSGLGLTIVRSIVELHGGRIWVESTAIGSAFHVALPVPNAEERDASNRAVSDR